MGCAFSGSRNIYEGDAPSFAEYNDRQGGFSFLGRKVADGNYSGEIGVTAVKAPQMSSFFGRTGIIDVLDTLGSSLSNLNSNSGFKFGVVSHGNKVSILAFEVANTIAKGAKLMQSLAEENIQFLKKEILVSEGVQKLISADHKELMRITATDKREEFHVFSIEVARFGDLCKDPEWHNLTRFFQKLDSDPSPQEKLKEEAEGTMQELISLAQLTSELYHELHALDRYERDYKQKLREEESFPTLPRGEGSVFLKHQKKLVQSLKKKSLWSRNLEEIVEKLVEVVTYLHKAISVAFGLTGVVHFDSAPVHNSGRLGVSGLALHYANTISKIENVVSRPIAIPSTTRDTLYHGLPTSVKAALRSRLQSFSANELTATQIKAEMQKTLQWLSPMAENTIKAHQGFGWVGEWANMGTEVNRKPLKQHSIARVQTLYHADKEKTEEHILQLVVWLHYLMEQVKNKGYGLNSCNPINYYQEKKGLSPSPEEASEDSSNYKTTVLRLSQEDIHMLECATYKKLVLGRSKSHGYLSKSEKISQRRSRLSRSSDSSPTRDAPNLGVRFKRGKILDVIDGLEVPDTFTHFTRSL